MKKFSHLLLRVLPVCGILAAMAIPVSAQNEIPNRKPNNPNVTQPSQSVEILSETKFPPPTTDYNLPISVNVPVYNRIDTPIRWYALENAENAVYWNAVNPERIWVKLEQGYDFDDERIAEFLQNHGLTEKVGEPVGPQSGLVRIFYIEGADASLVVQMARAAQYVSGIEFLEPSAIYKTHFTPNDPYYSQQWGPYVSNFGFAWDSSIGGNSYNVVAIIDDACDWYHEDLNDVVWYGWDYAQNDGDIYPDDPYEHKHGTHTTGTVAAKTNNGIGVAGMVSDTVYFAKVGNPDGTLSDEAIYEALYDIADIGRITAVNMSLGADAPSASIEQACNYAWNQGKILLVASGNNGTGVIGFPAAYPSAVAIGAIGTDGTNLYLTDYSQYGPQQELCAPGGDVSTGYGIVSCIPMNQYEAMEGTSMAAPHVTGLAGLMKHMNMDLSNSDIRNILAVTAFDFGNPGWDQVFGYGMINAQAAIQAAINGVVGTADINGHEAMRIYPNPATDRILIDRKVDVSSGMYEIFDLSGRLVQSTSFAAGKQTTVHLQGVAPGVYVLHMRSEFGNAAVRFVKL